MSEEKFLNDLWSDPQHWKLGIFYFCREDPRILVSKRVTWTGWSPNFARKGGYLILLFSALIIVIPFSFLCANNAPQGTVIKFLITIIVVLIAMGHSIIVIQKRKYT